MAVRRNKTVRDLVLSMTAIIAVVGVFAWLFFGASFSPGQASGGVAASADVSLGYKNLPHRDVPFAVAVPTGLPASWQGSAFAHSTAPPNTAASGAPATAPDPAYVRAGWLLPGGSFIEVVQSTDTVAQVETTELGNPSVASGSVGAAGATWTVSPGRRQELVWTRTSGPITFLITGDAPQSAFHLLATSLAGR